jgi:hypothetical protein
MGFLIAAIATTAAGDTPQALKMHKVAIRDVTMNNVVAYTMLIPDGWDFDGHVEWSQEKTPYPQKIIKVTAPDQSRVAFSPAASLVYMRFVAGPSNVRAGLASSHRPRVLPDPALCFRIDRKMFVLQALRDTLGLFHLDLFSRGIQRLVGFATFRRAAHVSGGMRERNTRFRHPDKFHGLLGGDRKWQRFRIGQADVFARENDDPTRDEAEIFAGVEHFREPVHGTLFIGSTHAFDKRADRVVMRVAGTIVNYRFLLNAFLGDREREVNGGSGALAALLQ